MCYLGSDEKNNNTILVERSWKNIFQYTVFSSTVFFSEVIMVNINMTLACGVWPIDLVWISFKTKTRGILERNMLDILPSPANIIHNMCYLSLDRFRQEYGDYSDNK